jgi:hypothetical protein
MIFFGKALMRRIWLCRLVFFLADVPFFRLSYWLLVYLLSSGRAKFSGILLL